MNQNNTYDISTDYLRYPTFSPLSARIGIRGDILRCSGCDPETDSGASAEVLHLSPPERPVFQIVVSNYILYILRPDGTVRTLDPRTCAIGNAFEGRRILSIAAGSNHVVALCKDGTVAVIEDTAQPKYQFESWSDIVAIAASDSVTFGLRSDGSVVFDGHGYLKGEDITDAVCGGGIRAIAAKGWHAAALHADGTVTAAGFNDYEQCNVKQWTRIKSIAASRRHTVGLRENGTVVATGDNESGQCNVERWDHIVSILALSDFTIGLRADGRVFITGNPDNRDLDYITRQWLRGVKSEIKNWRSVEEVAVSSLTIAARHKDGSISFTKPLFKLNVLALLHGPRLERALKKIFE